LANTNLVANHADSAGGAGYAYYGQFFMRDGRIADNTSDGVAGGLGLEGNPAHLERIVVINNTAQGNGGGLYIYDYSGVVVRNATISGNKSTSGAGGGIYLETDPSLDLTHSTITDNEASTEGGGIHTSYSSKFAYHASIIAGNRASSGEDCYIDSTVLSRGFNVFGDDTGCVTGATDLSIASSAVTTNLLLPLADNGGPTPTHAIRSGSLADNAADNDYCPLTDQRGTARQQNGFGCDIGAYERVNEQPASSGGSGGSMPGWGLVLLGVFLLYLRKTRAWPAIKRPQ
jgi:parallel beta-helix repeat protein